jgi:hypothetical protein
MDFIKKHYEKILLGLVLIGLVGALGYLPFKISSEKDKLSEMSSGLITPKVKPLTNLDLAISEAALTRATSAPVAYNFTDTNKLFNPMPWQRTAGGELVRVSSAGLTAVSVTNITPLYLKISLDAVTVQSDGSPLYIFGIEKQSALTKPLQQKKQATTKIGEKNAAFVLKEVQGLPTNPTNAVIQLLDSGEIVNVLNDKDRPWKRIDAYMADLRYDIPKPPKVWNGLRVNGMIDVNGEKYRVVAISSSEVILEAVNNGKKYTVKLNKSTSA